MHARLHAPHPFRAELGGREAVGEVCVYYFEIACVGLRMRESGSVEGCGDYNDDNDDGGDDDADDDANGV